MERFVIGAAIFAAVAIAAGGYFGHAVSDKNGFRIEINGDEDTGGGGTGAPSSSPSAAYAAHELKVRNSVAILKIIPEDRADIAIEIANPGRLAMPTVKVDGDAVVVDGGLGSRRIGDCRTVGQGFEVHVRGVGDIASAQAPVITAHVPRTVKANAGGAVWTTVGPAAAAELGFSGCGDVTLADVAGPLDLSTSGSGDVTMGAAQSAKISVAGSGDVTVGAVAQKLEISLAGSGGVTTAAATGPLNVSIAGSGDVAVNGGAVTDADISIAGSGGVSLTGDVQKLDVSIAGSGDVDVHGKAVTVDANIMGSGDVNIGAVTGNVEKAVMGSGSVNVGQ